jgi:hypothetical protein
VYYFYLDLYIYFGFPLARLKWRILLKSVRLPLQCCETEWEKIPKEVCQNLIESMPRRVEAVLRVKGGHTKY